MDKSALVCRRLFIATTVIASLGLTGTAYADTWTPDSSFSSNGTTRLTGELQNAQLSEITENSGLIYASGSQYRSSGDRIIVARMLSDGKPDNSFSGDGIASAPSENRGHSPIAYAHFVMADGSSLSAYLSAYGSKNSNKKLTVMRWTTDGHLDKTFSGDGVRKLAARPMTKGPNYLQPQVAVSADSQGRVVVGTMSGSNDGTNGWYYRLKTNGALDTSFASHGLRRIDLYAFDWVDALTTDGRDRLVIGTDNYTPGSGSYKATILRLTNGGSYDPHFSDNGRVRLGLGSRGVHGDYPLAIGINAGSITVALSGSLEGAYGSARLRANGSLDTTYGVGGILGLTCNCFPSRADVESGRVGVASIDFGSPLLASISPSGERVRQARQDLLPKEKNELVNDVALAGKRLLILGTVSGDTPFITRYQ